MVRVFVGERGLRCCRFAVEDYRSSEDIDDLLQCSRVLSLKAYMYPYARLVSFQYWCWVLHRWNVVSSGSIHGSFNMLLFVYNHENSVSN